MISGLDPIISMNETYHYTRRKKTHSKTLSKKYCFNGNNHDTFDCDTWTYKIIDILLVKTEMAEKPGKLCLSITPGKIDKYGNRNLTMDLQKIKDDNIKIIVCLLEWSEMFSLNIADYPKRAQAEGFLFYHLPIPDRGAPNQKEVNILIPILIRHLSAGRNVLVHCRGGLGRAGTICACCMAHFGYEWKTAISEVRQKRPGAIQTHKQEECVMQYCQRLAKAIN